MKATEAIEELKALVELHGDLDLTVAVSTYEYSIRAPFFNGVGPCPNIADSQFQNLQARFVFEAADDLSGSQASN